MPEKFNQGWRDLQPKQEEEPGEISPLRCFLGAVSILYLLLVGVVLVYLGLSL